MKGSFTSILLSLIIIQCNVIWKSPKAYSPVSYQAEKIYPPIMTLDEYSSTGIIDTHPRPYVYKIESLETKGGVLVFGAEHTKNPEDNQ